MYLFWIFTILHVLVFCQHVSAYGTTATLQCVYSYCLPSEESLRSPSILHDSGSQVDPDTRRECAAHPPLTRMDTDDKLMNRTFNMTCNWINHEQTLGRQGMIVLNSNRLGNCLRWIYYKGKKIAEPIVNIYKKLLNRLREPLQQLENQDGCRQAMQEAIQSELSKPDIDYSQEKTVCHRIFFDRDPPSCFAGLNDAGNDDTNSTTMTTINNSSTTLTNSVSTLPFNDSAISSTTHHPHPQDITVVLSVGLGFTFGLLLAALGLLMFCFIKNKRAKAEREVISQSNQPMVVTSESAEYASITGIYETITSTPPKASPVVPPAIRSRYSASENKSDNKSSLQEKQPTPIPSSSPTVEVQYAKVNKPSLEKSSPKLENPEEAYYSTALPVSRPVENRVITTAQPPVADGTGSDLNQTDKCAFDDSLTIIENDLYSAAPEQNSSRT